MVKRKKGRMGPEDEVETEETPPEVEPQEESPPEDLVYMNFEQIVQEVIDGKWGSGQDRRLRLRQAGYDHVAIQKEIIRRINST